MYSNLWHRFLSGDDSAFSILYEKFSPELYNYALKLGFNEEVSKDAIHDVFYTIFILRKKLAHVENAEFYLLHSLKNRLFDLYRKEKVMNILNHDDALLDSGELVIEKIINIEKEKYIKDTVYVLLQKLTPKQRKVIHYKYVLNLKNNEIAAMMDITPDAVKKILQRALHTMRGNSKNTSKYIIFILIAFVIS